MLLLLLISLLLLLLLLVLTSLRPSPRNILHLPCPPVACASESDAVAGKCCDAPSMVKLNKYRTDFEAATKGVTDGKPKNGVYADSCYVHEQVHIFHASLATVFAGAVCAVCCYCACVP